MNISRIGGSWPCQNHVGPGLIKHTLPQCLYLRRREYKFWMYLNVHILRVRSFFNIMYETSYRPYINTNPFGLGETWDSSLGWYIQTDRPTKTYRFLGRDVSAPKTHFFNFLLGQNGYTFHILFLGSLAVIAKTFNWPHWNTLKFSLNSVWHLFLHIIYLFSVNIKIILFFIVIL
jgi:hypothetical protein